MARTGGEGRDRSGSTVECGVAGVGAGGRAGKDHYGQGRQRRGGTWGQGPAAARAKATAGRDDSKRWRQGGAAGARMCV